jgi:hypothetical protein
MMDASFNPKQFEAQVDLSLNFSKSNINNSQTSGGFKKLN